MADDFIVRLSRAHGQLVRCLSSSIENKQLDCAANLHPIAQDFAAILTEMINRQNEILTRRGKMKLVKNVATRVGLTTPGRITIVVERPVQEKW